ncbi:phage tail protein [Paraburkholderia sp. BL10I2N1]|uniref:host specificity protein J n=1 Tax=Paraburkholderia sp. BL10I2N1 TaxID=1938796 RepID=UPI0010E9EB96|nr:phage tail protein [Paraburkholderia sp. BL10I2N1]TDN70647.1 putative tail protein [Paraburkholderia sp. BL10I2N1]
MQDQGAHTCETQDGSELIYPYSALAGVQVDASTFRAIPKQSFDTRMLRVQIPSNYDPISREYPGVWDGTFRVAWTDNPAWIFYDVAVTRRYGLGAYLNPQLMDKWTLYDISQYCDGMVADGFGGLEPRYTCNVYIQERADAIAVMQQFASIFNGMLFWSGGALTVTADRPSDPVMAFTPASVINGEFGYVGTPLNQRHTVALVTWNNPANRYEQEIEYVEDGESIAQFGLREAEVLAFGCTSRGLAHRIGRSILLTEQMLSETVSFKTGVNAAFMRPGDVFTTTDPTRAGARNGGRILGGDASTVALDAPVTITAGVSYRLSVMLPNGRLETRDVFGALSGDQTQLTVAPPFSLPVSRMGVWSLWASNLQSELWRCLSLTEDEDGNIQVNGVMYNASKFAAIEQGLALEMPETSIIDPFNIAPPSELNLTESLYQISPVIVGARVTFSWLAPTGAIRFQVAYQSATGSPVVEETGMNSIDVQPTTPGMWFFTVWAVNSLGIMSRPASIQRELYGLNRPPQNVQQFQLDIINDSANLTWQLATDLDVLVGGQLLIRYSPRMSTLVTWEESSEIARFAGSASNGFVPLMKGTYLAKYENSSGWLSIDATMIVSTTGPLRDMNVVAELPQEPLFLGEHINTVVRYGVLYVDTTPEGCGSRPGIP